MYGKKASTTVPAPDISEDIDPSMRRRNVALASNGTVASTGHPNAWAEKEGYGIANVNDGLAGDDYKFFMTAMDPFYQNEEMKVFLVFFSCVPGNLSGGYGAFAYGQRGSLPGGF